LLERPENPQGGNYSGLWEEGKKQAQVPHKIRWVKKGGGSKALAEPTYSKGSRYPGPADRILKRVDGMKT